MDLSSCNRMVGSVDVLSILGVETQKSVEGVIVIDVSTESGKDNDNHEATASFSRVLL